MSYQPPENVGERLGADTQRAVFCAEVLKALAHPLRLRIVSLLCVEPRHVTALSDLLCEKQAVISQQLRILRMRGVVRVERSGGYANYHLAEPRLRQLVHCMEGCTIRF
ncbi:MAG: winged helix-turn-helix transcriptional regulator [Deltaproteobacteria bacterium]|nr:winged helix-turn-helix transcriptional regulator [Deltaproteobacteria bacterium]